MFWDRPTDHQPTETETDLHRRWQATDRTRETAAAMISAARAHHPAGTDIAVYVGLALPGKTYGIWTHGQPVEEAPGYFLATTPDEHRAARDLADRAAGAQLAGRHGTSSYARLTAEEYCAVWEGIHGTEDDAVRTHVRILTSDGVAAAFNLSDGGAITVELDGREYVGVRTAEHDRPVQVVIWPDETGDDNHTFTPPGVPTP
jgi:hypothetical protein